MFRQELYDILGLSPGAGLDEVKRAFKRMALQCHPDHHPDNPHAEERFKILVAAYEILGDPIKKSQYDARRRVDANFVFPDAATLVKWTSEIQDILSDIFGPEEFKERFRRPRRTAKKTRGQDLLYRLEISFSEAALGGQRSITIPRWDDCPHCRGSKAESPKDIVKCPLCQGRGTIAAQEGFFQVKRACSRCQGAGREIRHKCETCRGEGRVTSEKEIVVTIPPGVESDDRLKIRLQGHPSSHGGPRGHLIIALIVKPHPFLTRDKWDLFLEMPIGLFTAISGGEISIPTLEGLDRLTIPPGTQSGQVFTLESRGLYMNAEGRRGALKIKVRVEVPVSLSQKQKKFWQQGEALVGEDNFPLSTAFLHKIKEYK